jgi:hypothetical protein
MGMRADQGTAIALHGLMRQGLVMNVKQSRHQAATRLWYPWHQFELVEMRHQMRTIHRISAIVTTVRTMARVAADKRRFKGWHHERHRRRGR